MKNIYPSSKKKTLNAFPLFNRIRIKDSLGIAGQARNDGSVECLSTHFVNIFKQTEIQLFIVKIKFMSKKYQSYRMLIFTQIFVTLLFLYKYNCEILFEKYRLPVHTLFLFHVIPDGSGIKIRP
jgi:hypothetical protein